MKTFLKSLFLSFLLMPGALAVRDLSQYTYWEIPSVQAQYGHIHISGWNGKILDGLVVVDDLPQNANIEYLVHSENQNVYSAGKLGIVKEVMVDEGLQLYFSLDLTDVIIPDAFSFTVIIKDDLQRMKYEATKQIGERIGNQNIRLNDYLIGDNMAAFSFENSEKEQELAPWIKVFLRNLEGEMIHSEVGALQKYQSLEGGSFAFELPTKLLPEVYMVQVGMQNEKEDRVGGYLTEMYLVEGDFGEFFPIQKGDFVYEEEGKIIRGELRGIARDGEIPRITGMAIQQYEGQIIGREPLSAQIKQDMREGIYFRVPIAFEALGDLDRVVFDLQIMRGDNTIESKRWGYDILVEDGVTVEEQEEEMQEDVASSVSEKKINYSLWIGLVLVLCGIIFLIVKRKKGVRELLIGLILSSTGWAGAQSFFSEQNMTVLLPISGAVHNQNSPVDLGFQNLHFQGSYTNAFVGSGLFVPVPDDVFVIFTAPDGAQYSIDVPNPDIQNNRDYNFIIDLSSTTLESGGTPFPTFPSILATKNGAWGVRVVFTGTGWSTPYPATPEISIEIDSTPPIAQDVVIDLQDAQAQPIAPNAYTNTPVTMSLSCTNGIDDCLSDGSSWVVEGAFCADGNICDTNGARHYRICDFVGNCMTQDMEMVLDFFDPVAPEFNSVDKIVFSLLSNGNTLAPLRTGEAGVGGDIVKAGPEYRLTVNAIDPQDGTGLNLDAHACGKPGSPFMSFIGSPNYCQESLLPCQNGLGQIGIYDQLSATPTCSISCPTGMVPDPTGQFCVPSCSFDTFPLCFDFTLF